MLCSVRNRISLIFQMDFISFYFSFWFLIFLSFWQADRFFGAALGGWNRSWTGPNWAGQAPAPAPEFQELTFALSLYYYAPCATCVCLKPPSFHLVGWGRTGGRGGVEGKLLQLWLRRGQVLPDCVRFEFVAQFPLLILFLFHFFFTYFTRVSKF